MARPTSSGPPCWEEGKDTSLKQTGHRPSDRLCPRASSSHELAEAARSSALLSTTTLSQCPQSLSDRPLQPMNLIIVLSQALGGAPGTGPRPRIAVGLQPAHSLEGGGVTAVKEAAFLIWV